MVLLSRLYNKFKIRSGCRSKAGALCSNVYYGPLEIKRSEIKNGIKIAAADIMGNPFAACTIMYQAGSRFEVDEIGASHYLRATADCSGFNHTAFRKMREVQQKGGYLSVRGDRQTVSFTLACAKSDFPELKYFLLEAAARNRYSQWELDDRREFIREDLVRLTGEQRVMDLIQSASFGGGLGNSAMCPESRISDIDEDTLNTFALYNLRPDKCSVGAVGLPIEDVVDLAGGIELSTVEFIPNYLNTWLSSQSEELKLL